jgi:hypothetical protein
MKHIPFRGRPAAVTALMLCLTCGTACAGLDERQRQLVAEITEKTGYELVEPEGAEEAYMAREIRGYRIIMMGAAEDVWKRWAIRLAAGEVGRELGGIWAYLTGSTDYGPGITGSVFDDVLSGMIGQPITFTMLLYHDHDEMPRLDVLSRQFSHQPADLPERHTRIAFGTGHVHTDDAELAASLAEDMAWRQRLRKLRSQYLRIDDETASLYFAGNENEYAGLINRHGNYYQMVNDLTELLADLADHLHDWEQGRH